MHYYIDSHAHLFFEDYNKDIEDTLKRAKDAGVKYCIVPGTDVKTSREAIALAERFENIYACVGIHPLETSQALEKDLEEIELLSSHPKVKAIGEIGLDYHYDFSPREKQREFFAAQIEIAIRCDLPVVVHTRESMNDALKMVLHAIDTHPDWKRKKTLSSCGVFHCFAGTAQEAGCVREMGFYISYPGIVTFKKSKSMETIKEIGIQNILLETDSPYMTPAPFRGKRNEPANIVLIARKIAEELTISEEEVAQITSRNAIRVFGLPQEEKTG
jgi:TatD DNase family protein